VANPSLTVRELLPQTGATNVAAGGDSGDLGDFILAVAICSRKVSAR